MYMSSLQVNVLSPLLLTLELLPLMLATAAESGDGRVLFVSSKASYRATQFDVEKLVITEQMDYDRLNTYSNTKLYDVS